jgi:hypothetical protein
VSIRRSREDSVIVDGEVCEAELQLRAECKLLYSYIALQVQTSLLCVPEFALWPLFYKGFFM